MGKWRGKKKKSGEVIWGDGRGHKAEIENMGEDKEMASYSLVI